ncbi:MAG: ATP-binding protein, partial [Bacteroidota bacterium]
CYDPLKNKTVWFDSSNKNIRSKNNLGLSEDPAGRICVFTDKGMETVSTTGKEQLLFVPFDPALNFRFQAAAYYPVQAMPDGRVVLAETNRLIVFDPREKKFSAFLLPGQVPAKQDIIQHLQIGKDGFLYLAAAGGVYRFEKDNRFSWLWQATSSNAYANDSRSFLMDRSGVMWFGTNASGMYKVDMQALPFSAVAYTVNFTTDLLSRVTGSPGQIPSVVQEGKWAYTMRYCYDRNNTLWLTYKDKEELEGPLSIYTVNKNTLVAVPVPAGMYPAIKGLSLSPSGTIYAMDLRGNIWKWENSISLPVWSPSVLSLAKTSSVVDMEADDNSFWVSTNKEGLYKIENKKVVRHFSGTTEKKYWPGDQLTDISKDPLDKDLLWIGTLGDGLIRLNKETGEIKIFTIENGLPNNTIYSIVPDDRGSLWISTNKGISRFTPATGSFCNFDVRDGIGGNEFNRFHHLRLPDGRIAFGGPEGYTLFDPAKFAKDSFATTIGLTRLLINNKPVDYSGTDGTLSQPLNQLQWLVLPHNKNFLQFEFAGLQYNQPDKIQYRYMLKGYDKEWIISGQYNVAGYTRLPPGNYTLLLNASNTSGNWSPVVKQLSIRIRPPFWATWWAWAIYFLTAVLLVRLYWRYRTNRIRMQHEIELEQNKAKQLKELDEIKNRFFSNITHEFRTPLTLILTPLEKLKDDNHYSPADQRILSGVYKNAGQLLRLINQLLDISKMESNQMKVTYTVGELAEFTERCVQQFSSEAGSRHIELLFTSDTVSGHYLFDEDKWEKIIFNLLSNALKFTTDGGKVEVAVSEANNDSSPGNMIKLAVTDTGKGISEKEIPKLFDRFYMTDDSAQKKYSGTGIGLALVKELADLMKGSITVVSSPGKGASFTISIPVEKVTAATVNKGNDQAEKNESLQKLTEPGTATPLVLVAEDNEELRSFLVGELSGKWRVLEAANGKTAHELILQELPEIVISDYMMPECDGETLCRLIKNDPRTAHISFIMLTAKAAHQSVITGLQAGADEYITKPFHLDELEQRLHNLAEQQKRLRDHLLKEVLPGIPLRKPPHVNDIFIRDLYKQLDELLDDPQFSVDALAKKMAMSQRTLNRKLKAIMNITPVEFIRRYRLQKAAILLSSGNTIADAAFAAGFETASYFSQCFKEEYGKTPTEFISQATS